MLNCREHPMAYFINDKCVGCTACETVCPVTAITGVKKQFYFIDPKVCIDCGACGRACPYDAIFDTYGNTAEKVRRTEWAPRLVEAVGTDVFAYHGYVEIMPGDVWVKATPTFNVTLCQKLGVPPLEFTGEDDALLQAFDANGREFMSYVAQHGTFFDVPAKFLIGEMVRLYPKLCQPGGMRGDMEQEGARR